MEENMNEIKQLGDKINVLNESNSAYQRKIEEIYEKHILLPKQGDAVPVTENAYTMPDA